MKRSAIAVLSAFAAFAACDESAHHGANERASSARGGGSAAGARQEARAGSGNGGAASVETASDTGGQSAADGGESGARGWTEPLDLSALSASELALPPPRGLDTARARALEMVAAMTRAQKLALVQGTSGAYVGNVAAVGGLPALTLQDGPAGVARLSDVTAFPAPITLAASWDRQLVERWGAAMGAEQRGKGVMVQLGPMMNLARSPLAGRNFEGFGEDPYLVAELAARDVRGIQSQRVVATAKHFVGNEQETNRFGGNSLIDERTLHEIYYPPFEASVSAGVGAVMCAYNRLNGVYACEQPSALADLKEGMGFLGWVMSDWEATHSTVESANAGLDMEMPLNRFFSSLGSAVADGSVPATRLDDMATRILTSLIRAGIVDNPPRGNASSRVASEEHSALAREAATAGVTLLKNERDALPLAEDVESIAVLGAAGHARPFALGGGSAAVRAPYIASPLTAITQRAGAGVSVSYAAGDVLSDAVAAAHAADAAVIFVALDSSEGVDRATLALPAHDDALIAAVAAVNPRTIVVLNVPSGVLMPWLDAVSSVLVAWYPGQENGNAIAPVLFGDVSPSGKLPVTFPARADDLPAPSALSDVPYSEQLAVGYRSFDARGSTPLFPFGHGLSYTRFSYSELELAPGPRRGSLRVSFWLENSGERAGAEIAQLYLGFPEVAGEPPRVLRGFERVSLAAKQRQRVTLELPPRAFSCWSSETHSRYVPSGTFEVFVGGSSRELPLRAKFDLVGSP